MGRPYEPLVDPMAGGGTIPIEAAGLAVGRPFEDRWIFPCRVSSVRRSPNPKHPISFRHVPRILALDVDSARIPAMVGKPPGRRLTGPAHEDSIVIASQDVRSLTPDVLQRMLPAARDMKPGVFCLTRRIGVRMTARRRRDKGCCSPLYSDMGRALARFSGWRAACFVGDPQFVEAFGHLPS